jgi:hypothetical protein
MRVSLTCRHGHADSYDVQPDGTTSCKTCKVPGACDACTEARPAALLDGARVVIKNSKANRERTAQHSPAAAPGAEAGQLADYWRRQTPPAAWQKNLGAEGDPCPTCERPMRWAGASTALVCLEHAPALWARSAGAEQRAAAYLASKARPGAEVAVRGGAEVAVRTAAESRAERVQFGTRKRLLKDHVHGLIENCDGRLFNRQQHQRAAQQMRSWLTEYLGEIDNAADAETLGEVASEIQSFEQGAEGYASPEGYAYPLIAGQLEQDRQEREHQQRAREWHAEQERRDEADALAAERQRQADAQAEAAERRQAQARARKPPPPAAPTSGTAAMSLAVAITAMRAAKDKAIQESGECQWKHAGRKVAERLYGVGGGYAPGGGMYINSNAPQARACSKHFAAAEAWMAAQGFAGDACLYWPA